MHSMHETSCCDNVSLCSVRVARTCKLLNSKTSKSSYGGCALSERRRKCGAKFMRRCRTASRRKSQSLTAHLEKILFIGHYSVFPRTRPDMQCKYCLIEKELIAAPEALSVNHIEVNIVRNLSLLYAFQSSSAFGNRLKLHNLHFKSTMGGVEIESISSRASDSRSSIAIDFIQFCCKPFVICL